LSNQDIYDINNNRIEAQDVTKPFLVMVFKLLKWETIMHNLVSYNQLAGSYEDEHDTLLTEYYECLIECEDDQSTCKRICKEVLI
jgi:hypothetical protein